MGLGMSQRAMVVIEVTRYFGLVYVSQNICCGGLNRNGPPRLIGSGTIRRYRRCDFVGVGVTLLLEVEWMGFEFSDAQARCSLSVCLSVCLCLSLSLSLSLCLLPSDPDIDPSATPQHHVCLCTNMLPATMIMG